MPGNGMFTPGPILHYVVFPNSVTSITPGIGFFLGTHVTSPKQRGEFYEIPVYNDLGGRSARFQSINDGEEWTISTTLNRFDYNIVRMIRYLKSGIAFVLGGIPNPAAFPLTGIVPPLGSQNLAARGSLVMGQQDFTLVLVNSFFGTVAVGQPLVAALDLHNVRGFTSCTLEAYEEDEESTRVTEVSMAIKARGLFNPTLVPATINNTPAIPTRGFGTYFEGSIPSAITLNAVN